MWDVLVLIGWILAVARVTRLIAMDRITEGFRVGVVRHFGEQHPISYLVNCMWCVSIWVALPAMPALMYLAHRTWPQALVFALAASYVTGMLSRLDDDEMEFEIDSQ